MQIYNLILVATISVILQKYLLNTNAQNSLQVMGRNSDYGLAGSTGAVSERSDEEYAPRTSSLSSQEPSCEELRAMWRFSKRQSRASEITNEIPTYHDPFTYNIWDMYTKSVSGR